jgi:hypothetical protein
MSRPARREKTSPHHPIREGSVHPRIPGRGPRAASMLVMRDGRGADLETMETGDTPAWPDSLALTFPATSGW